MNKAFLLTIVVATALLIACSKEDATTELLPPNNFQPTTSGSTWVYAEYPVVNVFSVKMTGLKDSVQGKVHYQVYNTRTGYSWFYKDGSNYYNRIPVGSDTIEFPYLKDNVPVGATWKYEKTISGFDTRYQYKIKSYDQPQLVNGRLYKRCIVVNRETYIDYGMGSDSLVSVEDYYYANDIGLVLTDFGQASKIYLSSYKIN